MGTWAWGSEPDDVSSPSDVDGGNPLFSTDAPPNAQIIDGRADRQEGPWTTGLRGEPGGRAGGFDVGNPTTEPPPGPRDGGGFSAYATEPRDVIDAPAEEDFPWEQGRRADPADARGAEEAHGGFGPRASRWTAGESTAPRAGQPGAGGWAPTGAPAGWPRTPPVRDEYGLADAVNRLPAAAADAATAPLAVVGALLVGGERVIGLVSGAMLGNVAVVVLTNLRVLVVTARRWQPLVDVFPISPTLQVRGRHDSSVAMLTIDDSGRASMVDNITEIDLAVELATQAGRVVAGR